MYIMNVQGTMIVNSEFVERFLIAEKGDACLIIASYNQERPPVTMGRYKDIKEASDILGDLFRALIGGQPGYSMPDSTYYYEQEIIKDSRIKRKGGS